MSTKLIRPYDLALAIATAADLGDADKIGREFIRKLFNNRSVNSAVTLNTKYRKEIRNHQRIDNETKEYLLRNTIVMPQWARVKRDAINKQAADSSIDRHIVLNDEMEYVDKSIEVLRSIPYSTMHAVAVAIGLLTGRKFSELQRGIRLTEIDTEENIAMFGGQLTKGSVEIEDYEIPLLASAKLVIKGVEFLNAKHHRFLSPTTARLTCTHLLGLGSFKDLRGIYGAVCLNWFNDGLLSRNDYLSEIYSKIVPEDTHGVFYSLYKL